MTAPAFARPDVTPPAEWDMVESLQAALRQERAARAQAERDRDYAVQCMCGGCLDEYRHLGRDKWEE